MADLKSRSTSHNSTISKYWQRLEELTKNSQSDVQLDGEHLNLAEVIAVSRYGSKTRVEASIYHSLQGRVNALQQRLDSGDIVYGVKTGFGGSADTRTDDVLALQNVLIRELHYGLLPPGPRDTSPLDADSMLNVRLGSSSEFPGQALFLPRNWARAAILIRINSLIKGFSGVRPVVIDRLQDLLKYDIIPMIPLRGSISASGDLSPLSYIAGAIQGKSTVRILSSVENTSLYADTAFAQARIEPISLQAKEGLAIVNGTAISTAVGALALSDTHHLVLWAQLLTAMSVEALTGTAESFHPVFAQARPHPGQVESAHNILSFLSGSKLIVENDGTGISLRQDRYSIRTAPQWLGPILEDLQLANQQITVECNSATDNPLVTPEGACLHGGNFQAKAVASAMEKTRAGIEAIGRMLFAQCTELINPSTNRGLPPNLVAEDLSYIFKGTDLCIAALQSELGFLAHPVNHVQTAEMGNQSLNSLALISARYTMTSVDVLSQMISYHMVALCQALDLRAMQREFENHYKPLFEVVLRKSWIDTQTDREQSEILEPFDRSPFVLALPELWDDFLDVLLASASMSGPQRFASIRKSLGRSLLDHPQLRHLPQTPLVSESFGKELEYSLSKEWRMHCDAWLDHGDASSLLGQASRGVYLFVRRSLGVPMLCTRHLETPYMEAKNGSPETISPDDYAPTVGTFTSRAYRAMKDGTASKLAANLLLQCTS